MRSGRKLLSKKARAASSPGDAIALAWRHTLAIAATTRRAAGGGLVSARMARQLAKKVAKAVTWSSAAQPSSWLQAAGSRTASGNFSEPGPASLAAATAA